MDETGALQQMIESLSAQVVHYKTRISRLEVLASEEGVSTEDDENLWETFILFSICLNQHLVFSFSMSFKCLAWDMIEYLLIVDSL